MKKTLFRALCLLTLGVLLILTVSCRGGEETVTTTTAATAAPDTTVTEPAVTETTVTETATVTSAQVTEPPAPEGIDPQKLCLTLNQYVEILFAEESGERVDAEEMLDTMLPYLMGGNEGFSLGESYRMHDVTTSGNGLAMPSEIISQGGVTMTRGEDPEYGAYSEIEVSHENGTVLLSTYDGVTTVDDVALNSDDSPLGDLDSEAMLIKEEHLLEKTEDGVWTVSDLYTRQVLRALLGKETVEALKNEDMDCTLDAREFDEAGTLLLNVVLSKPVEMRLSLRLEKLWESRQTIEMSLSAGENEVILTCVQTEGVMDEMRMCIRSGESVTEVVQKVDGKHTDLTMLVKAGDVVNLSCKMALDMIGETEGRGTVEVTFRVGEDPNKITLLSASDAVESVAKGEFAIRLDGDKIGLMEMVVTATAATTVSETNMMLVQSGAAVGETVMYYAMRLTDTADPSLNSAMEMELKLTERVGEKEQYALGLSMTDSTGTATTHATITTPSDADLHYTEQERQLVLRAERFLKDYEDYAAEAQAVVESFMQQAASLDLASHPSPFYMKDQDGDGIVVLVEIVENGGYYIYADILLDVENTTYWYCEYDNYFRLSKLSGFYEDRNWLAAALNGYDDHTYEIEAGSNAIGYYFEPEQGIYIVCDANNVSNCGYTLDEPTPEDFPGRALHKVTVDEQGAVVGAVHDMEITYDEHCVATLSCRTCRFRIKAYRAVHDDTLRTVICESEGRRPRTEYHICSLCGRESLTLTDGQGDTLRVLLEKATQANIMMENTFRPDPISWELVGSRRDLSDCLIISDIGWAAQGDMSGKTFDCDIIIPDLRASMGRTILGMRFDDTTYQINQTSGLTVVLPEGMEYVGCYGSVFFSQVAELTLPETLRCLSDGALGGYAGETLVLPASITYFPDDGFQMQNLRSLTIKGAHYEISPYLWCPNLEELICLGTFDVFRGFGTPCKIEEFTVPAGVRIISSYAFSRMTSLKSLILPEGVTEIERQAFEDCKNLSEIVLPVSLEKIGGNAFKDCDALTRVEMRGVKEIGSSAFMSCDTLEEVVVGEVLTKVGNGAFSYCSALKKINLPATAVVADDAFRGCTSLK